MNAKQVETLRNGLYNIYWKSGGVSLAAVGTSSDGTRWIAPTNWVAPVFNRILVSKTWHLVKSVEPVNYELPTEMPKGSSLLGRRPCGLRPNGESL